MSLEDLLPVVKAAVRELRESDRLPVMLTYKRAAEELSIGLTKLRSLVDAGEIRSRLVGERKMIPASEVLKFAEGRAVRTARVAYKAPLVGEGDKIRARLKARRSR